MGLVLRKDDVVFLDTSPFIYFFERHHTLFPYMERLFNLWTGTPLPLVMEQKRSELRNGKGGG
jgi:hypothetical protein